MPRFLKTRHAITVFKNHTPHAPIVATVAAGEVVPYNREKLRHGIRWIEVFMADGTLGYVRKNSNDFFICLRVKLNDHLAQGFDFATQVDDGRKVNDLFLPVSPIDGSAALSGQGLQARVELRRIEDSEKKKIETLVLAYDPAVTTVTAFAIEENEEFYVVYASGVKKDSLIEIDNLVDKRGYLLASTSYIEVANQWIYQIGVVVMMLVVLCIVIACFAAGWIVMGAILIIPGIILGFASIVVLQLASMLIKAMVHEIRVRL